MDIQLLLKNLKKRGFEAEFFKDQNSIIQAVKKLKKDHFTVGFGGSATLRQLGIPQYLKEQGVPTFDHWEEGLSREQLRQIRLAQGRCSLFMTSVNACTQGGRLVLVDGVGNRVSASIFGPDSVVFVFGTNKITENLHKAVERIKNIAGPMRAKSLNVDTPCVKTGVCEDCRSQNRICRARLVLEYSPMAIKSKVWIVDGEYGY